MSNLALKKSAPRTEFKAFQKAEPPQAKALNHSPPRRLKDEFHGMFAFKTRTPGEDIGILRSFMHMEGLPAIPGRDGITTFATVFARFVLPRRGWPHFDANATGRAEAIEFLRQWANAVTPRLLEGGRAKPQARLHKNMSAEIAAYYSPEYLGREVR